mgnify:CR=1 FL=1
MKVIFMGTPDFAVGTLNALVEAGHEVTLAVTQPDKPKGRGKAMQFTPVKEAAAAHNIPVYQPKKIREPECVEYLSTIPADVIVVVAFGQILPKEILEHYGIGMMHYYVYTDQGRFRDMEEMTSDNMLEYLMTVEGKVRTEPATVEEYESFLDMLYGKFGKSIVEKFLKPYNEKLYACDLNTLDKEAMGRFFPYANINQIINNMKEEKNKSYNDKFLYPQNGAKSFLDKLYNNLDKNNVMLNTEIISIDYEQKVAITNNNQRIKYEYLINTAPLNKFLNIDANNEKKNKENNEMIDRLSYNKVLVFNLGFEKKSDFDEHWIYFPDKNLNFYRVGFYDNILNSDRLSMYIEIGYNKHDENIDVEKQLKETLENLEKIGIVKDNKLVSYSLSNIISDDISAGQRLFSEIMHSFDVIIFDTLSKNVRFWQSTTTGLFPFRDFSFII